jgi:hypothetical protein
MELDAALSLTLVIATSGRDARDTSAETDTSPVFIGYE